jgi:hypothetical protein
LIAKVILRSSLPGRTATYDQQGRLLSPAMIGVAQPDFLDHVRVGEKISFRLAACSALTDFVS